MKLGDLTDKEYIGDGVYAGFDRFGVWVWTDRPPEPPGHHGLVKHFICLEPEVFEALTRYRNRPHPCPPKS